MLDERWKSVSGPGVDVASPPRNSRHAPSAGHRACTQLIGDKRAVTGIILLHYAFLLHESDRSLWVLGPAARSERPKAAVLATVHPMGPQGSWDGLDVVQGW